MKPTPVVRLCLLLSLAACGPAPERDPVEKQKDPEPTCTDQQKNGDETDVDCGGSCGGCLDGKTCAAGTDCASGTCEGTLCLTPPACDDEQKNGDETDVDCGGSCDPCADGGACLGDGDCGEMLSCQGSFCAPRPLTCGEGLECSDGCTGPSPGPCRLDCIQRTGPGSQNKLLTLAQCMNEHCPTQGGGVCDSAAPGFDQAACDACFETVLDFEGACWDPLVECINDEG